MTGARIDRPQGDTALSPRQCRAALALLDWNVRHLGRMAGTDHRAIRLWERGLNPQGSAIAARLYSALVAAGVEFRDNGAIWLNDRA